jgi:hypothetical protein
MNILAALRLLLDIYGALVLLIILGGAVFAGLLPYHAFVELGALGFYLVFGVGFIAWIVALGFFRAKFRP